MSVLQCTLNTNIFIIIIIIIIIIQYYAESRHMNTYITSPDIMRS